MSLLRSSRHAVGVALALTALAGAACGDGASGQGDATSSSPSSTSSPSEPSEVDGDGAGGSGEATEPSEPLASAADAPAAQGSGLTEAPGPVDRELLEGFGEVAIAIVREDGSVDGWCALLAETAEQRRQGLMEVVDLGGYVGMLFVDEAEEPQGFWMRNTVMPLTVAWFDDDGNFVSAADMTPCPDDEACPTYSSDGPARFSLEIPRGQQTELGIGAGTTLNVGGSCA